MFYRSAHRIAQRVAQYLGELTDYHFTLVHKPGTSNHTDVFSQHVMTVRLRLLFSFHSIPSFAFPFDIAAAFLCFL